MDTFAKSKRSEIMRSVGRRDTAPEIRLRGALSAAGLRYRVQRPIGKRKPDLAFVGARLVVFVDGCFWHGCPSHFVNPDDNADFWRKKIRTNRARDKKDNQALAEAGWTTLRFWECEVETDLDRVVRVIRKRLSSAVGMVPRRRARRRLRGP